MGAGALAKAVVHGDVMWIRHGGSDRWFGF